MIAEFLRPKYSHTKFFFIFLRLINKSRFSYNNFGFKAKLLITALKQEVLFIHLKI
ncbi:hypothetical protein SAMN05216324_1394 [Chryseobacterium limigenitum]|uniref:Uncharacterized protein n=1 Tax=Chryseobacterium limigenitum TaxID=1612149 RepID=A0A1K2IZ89_9FLAO|nr:hypothetical protein SAMN05216324_1394 [Chryseobacterium limigenitum]